MKFPKACGCAGPGYISMCWLHQQEEQTAHRRRMGMDRIKVPSPSAVCAVLQCRRIDPHEHEVVA